MKNALFDLVESMEYSVHRVFEYEVVDEDDKKFLKRNKGALIDLDTYAFSLYCMDLINEFCYKELAKSIEDLIEVIEHYLERMGA